MLNNCYNNCCDFWQNNGLLLLCIWLLIIATMAISISEYNK